MKKILSISLFGVLSILNVSANATLISESASFSPVLIVDGSSGTTDLTFTDSGAITDVNVFIDFTKCDNPLSNDGTCAGRGLSYNSEIVFSLTSPEGSTVDLVTAGTYSGQAPGDRVGVLFDDAATTAIGGPLLLSGAFSPVGSLSSFNGENLFGNWTLFYQDTVGADPLSVNAWRLDVDVVNRAVPEPATLALFGIGLAGLGFARKKKKSV